MTKRDGLTLIEFLIVIGILGTLFAVLLPAVQKVREAALRVRSQNNLKQLMVGVHHYASINNNQTPRTRQDLFVVNDKGLFYSSILPLINGYVLAGGPEDEPSSYYLPVLVNTADPSLDDPNKGRSTTVVCYSANDWALRTPKHLGNGIPDGTSTTIAIAENYAFCGNTSYSRYIGDGFMATRPATFAQSNPEYGIVGDIYPLTVDGVTRAAPFAWTFQVRPDHKKSCFSAAPQTPFSGGMNVAMFDGSVRVIAGSVSEQAFWSAVTHNGCETSDLD